jgi:hypothetical protein
MKTLVMGLSAFAVLSIVLWYTLGSTGLAAGLITLTLIVVIFAAFFGGLYVGLRATNQGADIALRAQQVNAQENAQLIQLLRKVTNPDKSSQQAQDKYPMLPAGNEAATELWVDIPIEGVEDYHDQPPKAHN